MAGSSRRSFASAPHLYVTPLDCDQEAVYFVLVYDFPVKPFSALVGSNVE